MKAPRGTYSKAIQNLEVNQEVVFTGEPKRTSVSVVASKTGTKMSRKFTVKTVEGGVSVRRLS